VDLRRGVEVTGLWGTSKCYRDEKITPSAKRRGKREGGPLNFVNEDREENFAGWEVNRPGGKEERQ